MLDRDMGTTSTALSIDGDRLRVPASALEHAGFRAWVKSDDLAEGIRATFARGEVFVEVTPESIDSHSQVKAAVQFGVELVVRRDDLGEVYPDGVLLTHEEAALSAEPDLSFASWATLSSGRLRFAPKSDRPDDAVELVGTPDLVVEVVSDSSVRKDLAVLPAAYAAADIPEYWIIDARGESLRFEILSLGADGYEPRSPAGGEQWSAVLGRGFTLSRRRNRVGRWRYELAPGAGRA